MIVMNKPLLDSSPQEGNTESYSRSLRASSTLENFRRKYFRKFSVIMKITKIFSHENLALPYSEFYLQGPSFCEFCEVLASSQILILKQLI